MQGLIHPYWRTSFYLFEMIESQYDRLFEVACVSVTDSDSHDFGVDLIALFLLTFHSAKETICRVFQVCIAQM